MTDLDLALTYVPRPQRLLLADLFALDAALGQVVRTTREPMIGRIRLAWWRERLQELDEGKVPAEPQLEATARLVGATSLTGARLAELVACWEPLLDDFPWGPEVVEAVANRGRRLFGSASAILNGDEDGNAILAGSAWSLVDVARHCTDERSRTLLIETARKRVTSFQGSRVEAALRPLTMLGILARRDVGRWPEVELEATPARAWAMIRHKLMGRL